MAKTVSEVTAASIDTTPKKPHISLQWITYATTKAALSNQMDKQKSELEKLKVAHNFTKELNQLRGIVKPREDAVLTLNNDLSSLDALKNFSCHLENQLKERDLPESLKKELIESAKVLEKSAAPILAEIEKDNLNAAARKDVKEDLDNLIKQVSEDNSMQLNMVTRIMNNLHEMYAMARSIMRTVHDSIQGFTRNIHPR